MSKIKAIIFDMDGVLIDAKEWHFEALNRALGYFGYSISRYEHLITYDGLPTRRKLEMLTLERGLPRQLHPFINELKQQYTMELTHARCKPMFQHEYALSRLKQDGYLLGLASNSVAKTVEVMMDKSRLATYMDTMLSNEDVVSAKPAPDIYRLAAERLGLDPGTCVAVEDNENGIRSATTAGFKVVVVDAVHDVTYDRLVHEIRRIELDSQ